MHRISTDNCQEAQEAIRDILLLYVGMADSYSGFGHAVDVAVRFDPLKFVDAELADELVWIDIDLLRTGSAIAILCFLYDLWCEFEAVNLPHPHDRYTQAIECGRLRFSPDVEAVAREALKRDEMPLEDPWFDEAVEPIYRKHVLGYFDRLSKMERRRSSFIRKLGSLWRS